MARMKKADIMLRIKATLNDASFERGDDKLQNALNAIDLVEKTAGVPLFHGPRGSRMSGSVIVPDWAGNGSQSPLVAPDAKQKGYNAGRTDDASDRLKLAEELSTEYRNGAPDEKGKRVSLGRTPLVTRIIARDGLTLADVIVTEDITTYSVSMKTATNGAYGPLVLPQWGRDDKMREEWLKADSAWRVLERSYKPGRTSAVTPVVSSRPIPRALGKGHSAHVAWLYSPSEGDGRTVKGLVRTHADVAANRAEEDKARAEIWAGRVSRARELGQTLTAYAPRDKTVWAMLPSITAPPTVQPSPVFGATFSRLKPRVKWFTVSPIPMVMVQGVAA